MTRGTLALLVLAAFTQTLAQVYAQGPSSSYSVPFFANSFYMYVYCIQFPTASACSSSSADGNAGNYQSSSTNGNTAAGSSSYSSWQPQQSSSAYYSPSSSVYVPPPPLPATGYVYSSSYVPYNPTNVDGGYTGVGPASSSSYVPSWGTSSWQPSSSVYQASSSGVYVPQGPPGPSSYSSWQPQQSSSAYYSPSSSVYVSTNVQGNSEPVPPPHNGFGEPGQAGATGYAGFPGAPGYPGPTGPTGWRGPEGDRGAPGTPGAPGNPGSEGLRGATGPSGPGGPSGLAGTPGLPGNPEGPTGATGGTGFTGYTGPSGPLGVRGPDGRDFIVPLPQVQQQNCTGAVVEESYEHDVPMIVSMAFNVVCLFFCLTMTFSTVKLNSLMNKLQRGRCYQTMAT